MVGRRMRPALLVEGGVGVGADLELDATVVEAEGAVALALGVPLEFCRVAQAGMSKPAQIGNRIRKRGCTAW